MAVPPRAVRWPALVTVALVVALSLVASTPGRARAQEGLLLYVPNQTTNNVSVFQTNADGTLSSVSTISVGNGPAQAVVRGDQAFAYVTNNTTGTVSVIDTRTQTVVQTISAGSGPRGLTLSPDGSRLYVANNGAGANSVTVYGVSTLNGQLTTLTTLTSGLTTPREVAVSPDGSRLYVVNQGANSVRVFDTATNTALTTINVGAQPTAIATNAAGTRAYVTNFNDKTVSVINTATNTVVATANTGNGPLKIVVSPDGSRFYVANSTDGTISQFNASDNSSIGAAISTNGATIGGLGITPDGSFLYAVNQQNDLVALFSVGSNGALSSLGTKGIGLGNSDPAGLGLCGNGSSASGLLGNGRTFVANTSSALRCAGSTASFTGGTLLVNGSNLRFTTPLSLGTDGGTIDTNGNDATVASAISGSGGLTKTGTGTLTLEGDNTYTGGTTVAAGTLSVNGSLTSAVTVNNDATLSGIGTITGAVLIQSGGTLAPGNSIGTLHVTGGFTFASGAKYTVEINAAGQADLIQITGTATLNGGTVNVQAAPGVYGRRTRATILTATDGISGTFDGVTSSLAFLTPSLVYDATSVTLVLSRNDVTYAAFGRTGNQRRVGEALDILTASAGGDLATVFDALTALDASDVPGALRALSGETHASALTLSLAANERYLAALRDRLAASRLPASNAQGASALPRAVAQDTPLPGVTSPAMMDASLTAPDPGALSRGPWWMAAYGNGGFLDSNHGVNGIDYATAGTAGGLDLRTGESTRAGVSVGYGHTWGNVQDSSDRIAFDTYQVGAYGRWEAGVVDVDGLLAYAYDDYGGSRAIQFGAIDRRADGDTAGHSFAAGVEVGRTLPAGRIFWRPAVGLTYRRLVFERFTETGGDGANLTIDQTGVDSLGASVDLRAGTSVTLGSGRTLVPEAHLRYTRELLDPTPTVRAQFAGTNGGSFSVHGLDVAVDRFEVGARVVGALARDVALAVEAAADLSPVRTGYSLSGQLTFAW